MTSGVQKTIYLSGGGGEQASFPLDRFFFASIPQNGTLLYLPVALRGHRLFDDAEDWFRGVMKLHNRHEDITLEVWSDLNGQELLNLGRFDAIYVGGGNTWSLMKEITESGFREVLEQYIQTGGLYYGGSAGAIICGSRIDTHKDGNTIGWKDLSGMNLLNDLSVVCHVKEEQFGELENMAREKQLRLLALAENAGAIVESKSYRCVGEGICREFQ
jgi:dipeptidase E